MKRFLHYLIVLASLCALSVVTFGCGGSDEPTPVVTDKFSITGVILPSQIDVVSGGDVNITGNGFKSTDHILLAGTQSFDITAKSADASTITFTVPAGFVTGKYTVSVSRGEQSVKLGSCTFNLTVNLSVPDTEGMTVKGVVYCNGVGLKGVVVSDGFEVTSTDQNGVYYLPSEKRHGYVFVSLPGGYKVPCIESIIPQFFQRLTGTSSNVEQRDFSLTEVDQSKFGLFVMGDIHLANRVSSNNDISQFSAFVEEAANFVTDYQKQTGTPMYGITLGDMSWDQYWVTQNFDLSGYMTYAKGLNFPVFHTIGNHDHNCYAAGDWQTVVDYKKIIGPTYYSFNIGSVHCIVLDDIECTNTGAGPDGRYYNSRLVSDQIEWIKRDLSYVTDKSTPVFVTLHAPIYYTGVQNGQQTANYSLANGAEVVALFDGYTNVHFLSGHTHIARNVQKSNHFEHNIPAVCATWWWTGKTAGNSVCCDGAPGGYEIFEINGKDVKWYYKGIARKSDFQFRTYDLNQIELTPDKYCPSASDAMKALFTSTYAKEYANKRTDNVVYINIWNWDEKWTVDVTENGKRLDVTMIQTYDPLHIISYAAKRINSGATPTFGSTNTPHIFSVQASSASSTLEIKVTDRFGTVYSESMTRPKTLELNQ